MIQNPELASRKLTPDATETVEGSKRATRAATLLIAAGASLRVASFFLSDNSGGDAGARIGIAAHLLQHPVFKVIFDAYLPLHFWLIALFSLIFHDVTIAGRVLSLAAGIASLLLVWQLARVLYGETAGLLSLAVCAFYTLHIGYSTTSSAEVPFLFFLLGGFFFFFADLQQTTGSLWRLALSGLFLSCAAAIRYEGWVILGYMGLILGYVVLKNDRSESIARRLGRLSAFALAGCFGPAFIMFFSWRATGDPLRALTIHNQEVTAAFVEHPVSRAYQLILIPIATMIALSPWALAGAIYGLVKSFASRAAAAFAGLVLFFSAVQAYEIATGKLLAMARYSLTLGTMLAVVSGAGLQVLCGKVTASKRRMAYALVLVLLAINPFLVLLISEVPNSMSDKFASVSPRLRYATRIAQVAAYLRAHMNSSDAVAIDNYNAESNVIADAAGLPPLPGNRAYLANTRNSVDVQQYIANQRPKFLVYSDQGSMRSVLTLPPGCSQASNIGEVTFQCVFSNQIYRIYQLSYF